MQPRGGYKGAGLRMPFVLIRVLLLWPRQPLQRKTLVWAGLQCQRVNSLSPWWGSWQHAGGCGAGANPQAAGIDHEPPGLAWASESPKPTPQWHILQSRQKLLYPWFIWVSSPLQCLHTMPSFTQPWTFKLRWFTQAWWCIPTDPALTGARPGSWVWGQLSLHSKTCLSTNE